MPSLPRSLPHICVALGLSTGSDLSRAAEGEYKDGSTFFEFRLDYLPDPAAGIDVIRAFHRRHADTHVLATCRHKQNNGGFTGPVEQQLAILLGAAKAGAAVADLEVESAERAQPAVAEIRQSIPLMVSFHDFHGTPALPPVLRRLQSIPSDAYKIVTTARKPTDNLRLIEFAREHRALPLIAFAMSETGTPTRLLALSSGSKFTYASPASGSVTGSGQVSAHLMRTLYRLEKVRRQTRMYGIVADPVTHSKSPILHNRAFQCRRVDAVYLPFLVAASQIGDWMRFAAKLPMAGFSVTFPHKQRILRYLDVVEPLAKRIGAVNTVWRKAGKWRGTNTDTEGAKKPLSRHLRLAHASVLIAGYGGAARAAGVALADLGAKITITGRNMKRAQALAQLVKAETVTLDQAQKQHYDALLNATPVGMSPKTEECLFKGRIPAGIVFDMVYEPHQTLLLKRAQEQGCAVIYGAEMLLEQAACQFEIWTGESAPRSVMQSALEQHFLTLGAAPRPDRPGSRSRLE